MSQKHEYDGEIELIDYSVVLKRRLPIISAGLLGAGIDWLWAIVNPTVYEPELAVVSRPMSAIQVIDGNKVHVREMPDTGFRTIQHLIAK